MSEPPNNNPLPPRGNPVLDGTDAPLTIAWYKALQRQNQNASGGITQLTGDVLAGPGGGVQNAQLSDTGVVPGTYTNADIHVDAQGRIIEASDGSATPAGDAFDPLAFAAISLLDGQPQLRGENGVAVRTPTTRPTAFSTRVQTKVISTTTHTLDASDLYLFLIFTNAFGCAVTVPTDASALWGIFTQPVFALCQGAAAGQITVTGAGGVTVDTLSIFKLKSYGPNAVMQLIETGADTWNLFGAQEPI